MSGWKAETFQFHCPAPQPDSVLTKDIFSGSIICWQWSAPAFYEGLMDREFLLVSVVALASQGERHFLR